MIEGIKISQFEAIKAQIMATAPIRTDYNECVSLYKTLIDQSKKVSPPNMNISGLESSNHKGGVQKKHKGGSGGAIEYVYYSKEEYKALYSDHRAALYKKKQSRGHKPADKKVRSKWGGGIYELENQVSALLAFMKSAPESPGTATPSTNSKNTALTRQIILRELSVASVVRTM